MQAQLKGAMSVQLRQAKTFGVLVHVLEAAEARACGLVVCSSRLVLPLLLLSSAAVFSSRPFFRLCVLDTLTPP